MYGMNVLQSEYVQYVQYACYDMVYMVSMVSMLSMVCKTCMECVACMECKVFMLTLWNLKPKSFYFCCFLNLCFVLLFFIYLFLQILLIVSVVKNYRRVSWSIVLNMIQLDSGCFPWLESAYTGGVSYSSYKLHSEQLSFQQWQQV